MERRYTVGTVAYAIQGEAVKFDHRYASTAIKDGRLTTIPFPFKGKMYHSFGVRDIQTWLARTNKASVPEWILRRMLDMAADAVIALRKEGRGLAKKASLQVTLDKETGHYDANHHH